MDSNCSTYKKCVACENLICDKDAQNHLLICRAKLKIENKICVFCQKEIDGKFYEDHLTQCNEQMNLSSNSLSTTTTTTTKKQCPFCEEFVDDLPLHCQICEENNSGFETPRAATPIDSIQIDEIRIWENNCSKKKFCVLCSENLNENDYENHLSICSIEINEDNHPSTFQIKKQFNDSKKKQTKICVLCLQDINQALYEDHILRCSQNQQSSSNHVINSNTQSNKIKKSYEEEDSFQIDQISSKRLNLENLKVRKRCILCSNEMNESDYENHLSNCLSQSSSHIDKSNQKLLFNGNHLKKICALCSEEFNQLNYEDHLSICSSNDNQINSNQLIHNKRHSPTFSSTSTMEKSNEKKKCSLCYQLFDREDLENHLTFCCSDNKQNENRIVPLSMSLDVEEKKDCVICLKSINESEYINHVTHCSSNDQHIKYRNNEININSSMDCTNVQRKKDCILCFKPFHLDEYETHVLACLAETENQTRNSSNRTTNIKCFSCHRLKRDESDFFYEITCPSNHNYCLSCLQQSMNEFARNRQVPLCNQNKCDYKLSKHDISLIPLERRLSDRLIKLVKGEQRPYCNKCHFYINLNENESFDDHLESCTDLIPCEYCQLPYSFNQLEIHMIECRNEQISLNEKLIHFLFTRIKYPFTKEQIRFFLQQKNHPNGTNSFDPLTLIKELAIFGDIFPLELPQKDCDICMEGCHYDDIFVFDCPDSHKVCYKCYYRSCQTKMSNEQLLTCAICSNPLRDCDINQLRISFEELNQFQDYQMKKTFELYSNRTRGIIKCPKQNCTWIAQADDPNERFQVNCPLCQNQFCSLCNQQYHYRTTCQQLPQITQRWFFWCQNERNRYLTMRAQQDTTFAAQLDDYNRQKSENENRNRDLRRRYDELINDEEYKAQNCRLCPQCHRVVQRLEGCDSMICGQDAHGGNVQSGCGAKFNWAQATQYQSAATQQPKQTIIDLPKPNNPIVHHRGVKCDQCQEDVNGIRFDCVHCPSLTFCEKCEQQATLHHSEENQLLNQQQHVFKLIMTPEEEAF